MENENCPLQAGLKDQCFIHMTQSYVLFVCVIVSKIWGNKLFEMQQTYSFGAAQILKNMFMNQKKKGGHFEY